MGMPQSVSALAMTSAVRSSWKHSSGWAWMSRRMRAISAASARMGSSRFIGYSGAGGCRRPSHLSERARPAQPAGRAGPRQPGAVSVGGSAYQSGCDSDQT